MIRAVRGSNWSGAALVCRKCSKKMGGGFGKDGDEALHKALRKFAGKGRKASYGVIATDCLKLCPKKAVTVIDSRYPDQWLVVDEGTPVEAVMAALTSDQA